MKLLLLAIALVTHVKGESAKIAIIKADDVRGPTEKWDRFFALSTNKGVKVSAGIICESLQAEKPAYCTWLKK